jgi:hypothetical protein
MTLLMGKSSQFAAGRPGRLAPEWDASGSSADPLIQPPGYTFYRSIAAQWLI